MARYHWRLMAPSIWSWMVKTGPGEIQPTVLLEVELIRAGSGRRDGFP